MKANSDVVIEKGDLSSINALFRYGQGNYKQLLLAILMIFAASGCLMLSAKTMGSLAESLIAKEGSQAIIRLVLIILALEALNIFIYYQGRVQLAAVTNRVALGIRKALFRKLGRLPIPYYDQEPLGRTITRLTADVEGIESFFSNTMPRGFTASVTIISVLFAMIFTDLRIGGIIALSSLPAIIFTVALRGPVRTWLREYKKRSAALNSQLAEYINGLSVIRIFGIESWTSEQFSKNSEKLLDAAYRLMNWNSFIRPFAALLCALPIVVIIFWGGHEVLSGGLSIGLLVAFIRYGERYFRPIMMLSFELHLIQDAIASSDRVRKMLDEVDEDEKYQLKGAHSAKIRGKIRYQDLVMEYLPGKEILKGISFNVEAGQSVALVGQTGSGKSSTIQLIPQLYPIKSGTIYIDDIPIEQWSSSSIRSQMGIVSQDVSIFHGSIRDNLLATLPKDHPGFDQKELDAICQRTGLLEIILGMDQGFDSLCMDNGSNLSMGERQLIAFTRMLIRDPSILVLDEATANVDEGYEALIQNTIQEVLKGRTTFIIAHRLNTIRHCDLILVFDQGKIVESGSHEELMDLNGHYAGLVARQICQ